MENGAGKGACTVRFSAFSSAVYRKYQNIYAEVNRIIHNSEGLCLH